jgi:hypothetical protein
MTGTKRKEGKRSKDRTKDGKRQKDGMKEVVRSKESSRKGDELDGRTNKGNARETDLIMATPVAVLPAETGSADNRTTGTKPTYFSMATGMVQKTGVPGMVEMVPVLASVANSGCTPAEMFNHYGYLGRNGSGMMSPGDLTTYVRNTLFPKVKFLMDPKQLMFTNETDTICYHIWNELGINKDCAQLWWENNKNKISGTINAKRADISASIKEKFMSK